MRRSSFSTWMLLVSLPLALLISGGFALALYVVLDGMADAANEQVTALAANADKVARALSSEVSVESSAIGLTGDDWDRETEARFFEEFPLALRIAYPSTGEFAFYYGDRIEPEWSSSGRAVVDGVHERERALSLGQPLEHTVERRSVFSNMIGPARLGIYAVHVPVDVPGGVRGVLDVVYLPDREEAVIDSARALMAALAVLAVLIVLVVVRVAVGWALGPVGNLRRAADSIDAGRLDVRLPEEGWREIVELARSVNRLIDRLSRRAEMQTRFMADVSHELSTPVAGIRGYTNILKAWGGDDAEVRDEAVSAIDRESRRMARLCGDLLILLRSEQVADLGRESLDANALCREVLAMSATRYQSKGLAFEGPDEGTIDMIGNPSRIETVLSVLLDNACKYTPPGGRVSLSTRVKGDVLVFEVEDTGIGIPAEEMDSIFERFYRSESSRSDSHGGFGLGLAIAKANVDVMGGSIEVHSSLGEGTTFTVSLPRNKLS